MAPFWKFKHDFNNVWVKKNDGLEGNPSQRMPIRVYYSSGISIITEKNP